MDDSIFNRVLSMVIYIHTDFLPMLYSQYIYPIGMLSILLALALLILALFVEIVFVVTRALSQKNDDNHPTFEDEKSNFGTDIVSDTSSSYASCLGVSTCDKTTHNTQLCLGSDPPLSPTFSDTSTSPMSPVKLFDPLKPRGWATLFKENHHLSGSASTWPSPNEPQPWSTNRHGLYPPGQRFTPGPASCPFAPFTPARMWPMCAKPKLRSSPTDWSKLVKNQFDPSSFTIIGLFLDSSRRSGGSASTASSNPAPSDLASSSTSASEPPSIGSPVSGPAIPAPPPPCDRFMEDCESTRILCSNLLHEDSAALLEMCRRYQASQAEIASQATAHAAEIAELRAEMARVRANATERDLKAGDDMAELQWDLQETESDLQDAQNELQDAQNELEEQKQLVGSEVAKKMTEIKSRGARLEAQNRVLEDLIATERREADEAIKERDDIIRNSDAEYRSVVGLYNKALRNAKKQTDTIPRMKTEVAHYRCETRQLQRANGHMCTMYFSAEKRAAAYRNQLVPGAEKSTVAVQPRKRQRTTHDSIEEEENEGAE